MKKLFILTGIASIVLFVHAMDSRQLLQTLGQQDDILRYRLRDVDFNNQDFNKRLLAYFMKQNPRDILRKEIADVERATEKYKRLDAIFGSNTFVPDHALPMNATEQSPEIDQTGDVAAYEKYQQSYDLVKALRIKAAEAYTAINQGIQAEKNSQEKLQDLVDIKEELIIAVNKCLENAQEVYRRAAARVEPYNKIIDEDRSRYLQGYERFRVARARYERLTQYTANAVIGIAAIGAVGLGAYFANDFYTQCTRTLQQNWLFKYSASFFVVDNEK